MKKILFILFISILSIGCNSEYEYLGQEIVDGKISATQSGGTTGRYTRYPKIWVQSPTTTREVDIPFKYEGRWKVGDSCVLIIERYRIKK